MSTPIRILAVDVGTGTQDILLFESGKTIENCFKMVMPSPTVIIAERIKRATERGQPILLTGVTMGGGPCHWAARDHALAGYPVQQSPTPSAFAYSAEQTPTSLTRLQAIAASAARYQELSGSSTASPLLLMDTGSAAVLGSLEDLQVRQQRNTLLCNIGNFHTLAFHLVEGRIAGIFEHHTGEINRAQLEDMLVKLAQGTLTNDEVFNTSGHGALILDQSLPAHQSSALPFLAVTGPRREMLRGSSLHPYEATPHGDMMLAGCFGLLYALADHEPDLAPFIKPSLLPSV